MTNTTGKAASTLEAYWPHYVAVDFTSALCREAGALAERYRLTGYASVHLASYGHVARSPGAPDSRFSSFDDRLNRAARSLTRRSKR